METRVVVQQRRPVAAGRRRRLADSHCRQRPLAAVRAHLHRAAGPAYTDRVLRHRGGRAAMASERQGTVGRAGHVIAVRSSIATTCNWSEGMSMNRRLRFAFHSLAGGAMVIVGAATCAAQTAAAAAGAPPAAAQTAVASAAAGAEAQGPAATPAQKSEQQTTEKPRDGFTVGGFTFKPGGRVKLDVIRDFKPIGSEDSFDVRTIPVDGSE